MPQSPNCNTVLPNGNTVGQEVRASVQDTMDPGNSSSSADAAAMMESKLENNVLPYGPLDFKNRFRGQADPSALAAAGNFAYGAYVSALAGPSVSNFGATLYGSVSSLINTLTGGLLGKAPKFVSPNGMSKSGAANVPRGNANAGCPR